MPLTFADATDYERIDLADELEIHDFPAQIQSGHITVQNQTKGFSFDAVLDLSAEAKDVLLCGGQLRYLRKKLEA